MSWRTGIGVTLSAFQHRARRERRGVLTAQRNQETALATVQEMPRSGPKRCFPVLDGIGEILLCELSVLAAVRQEAADIEPARLRRAFEFLQLCDNLSLITCVRYPRPITLRHQHPRRNGEIVSLVCTPLSPTHYRVAPFPFATDELRLNVPARHIAEETLGDLAVFRSAYTAAPLQSLEVVIVR